MKLTEREKWLMQRAWDTSFTYCGPMEHWLKGRTESGMSIMHDHLVECAPKPESIVKKVDPDNLPEREVVGVLADHLYIVNFKIYEEAGISTGEITHYIEQKDLIKLFEDSK